MQTNQSIYEDWLGIKEASLYLKISTNTIYAYVSRGRIQPNRCGTRLLFARSYLDSWLQAQNKRAGGQK